MVSIGGRVSFVNFEVMAVFDSICIDRKTVLRKQNENVVTHTILH